jgi:hypothetical protein
MPKRSENVLSHLKDAPSAVRLANRCALRLQARGSGAPEQG